jgi:hypothetical protein
MYSASGPLCWDNGDNKDNGDNRDSRGFVIGIVGMDHVF